MPEIVLGEATPKHGFISNSLPHQWRNHLFVQDRFYFTFPRTLLEKIISAVGKKRFRREDLERERQLSSIIGDHCLTVGYWKECPVVYSYLMPRRPIKLDQTACKVLGVPAFRGASMASEAEKQRKHVDDPIRGYLGWLLTHKAFLEEHDELINQYQPQILEHGFPAPLNWRPQSDTYEVGEANKFTSDFKAFYSHWRLQTLAAPYLPLPLTPQLPDVWTTRAANIPEGGCSFFLPDISPVTGQGSINDGINGALRGTSPPKHLEEWINIVRKENASKNQIRAFGRRFRLQHFWIVLHERYPKETTRSKGQLIRVFADFLGVEETTIKRDLDLLALNIGPDWDKRHCELCQSTPGYP